jgi:hypothetical protein
LNLEDVIDASDIILLSTAIARESAAGKPKRKASIFIHFRRDVFSLERNPRRTASPTFFHFINHNGFLF